MGNQYPLQWPTGWKRTDFKEISRFSNLTISADSWEITRHLELMGATNIVISSNMRYKADGLPYAQQERIEDTGVAVYFTLNGSEQCIPCDKWQHVGENLRAINKTIQALRGIDRWGAKEMVDAAFRGFKALPESIIVTPYTARAWHEVLEVSSEASPAVVRAAYKQKLKDTHPDTGGSQEAFQEVQKAFKESGKS